MATPTKKGPGVRRPVLTDSSKEGLQSILLDLEGFYSPLRNDRGYVFCKPSRNVFDDKGKVFAYINILGPRSRVDQDKIQMVYTIFFNTVDKSKSFQERDAFLSYVNRG